MKIRELDVDIKDYIEYIFDNYSSKDSNYHLRDYRFDYDNRYIENLFNEKCFIEEVDLSEIIKFLELDELSNEILQLRYIVSIYEDSQYRKEVNSFFNSSRL